MSRSEQRLVLGLWFCVGLAAFALAASGCGASEWAVHGVAAQVMHSGSNTMRSSILAMRRDHLMASGLAARVNGGDAAAIGAAVEAAAVEWDRGHADLISSQRTLAGATNTYVRLALAASRGEADSIAELLVAGRHAAVAWNALAAIAQRHGIPLPEIPDAVMQFLGTPARPARPSIEGDEKGGRS